MLKFHLSLKAPLNKNEFRNLIFGDQQVYIVGVYPTNLYSNGNPERFIFDISSTEFIRSVF